MNRFVVIDLETNGTNPNEDRIIQIGAVLIEENQVIEEYSTYVNPNQAIPKVIQQLTGITNDMVKGAPLIEDAIVDLLPLLENVTFVAHNAEFDLAFIQTALEETGYEPFSGYVIDTLALSRILLPTAQSYKLTNITEELEISHDQPHRADEDAKATGELLIKLLNQLNQMPLVYLQRLQEILKGSFVDISALIDSAISKQLNFPSQEEKQQDHFVVNQIALKPVEEFQEEQVPDASYFDQLNTIFDEKGLLFEGFPNFELREGQKVMAEEVWNAFTDTKHLLVEAGTGTGKSLAYLIPAIFWSKKNDEKVVIATHTINLQEQLFTRDIPLVKEILPFAFNATVLKGRNNYVCLRKFEQLLIQHKNLNLNQEQTLDLAQFLTWLTITKTGDAEELNLSYSGRTMWNQIRSDAESCLNRQCPWFRSCFYHRARGSAQTADIIITNHSLLLTSVKTEHHILPAHNQLIIDEAHQFEDVASRHLGIEVSYYQASSLLQGFYKDAKNGYLVNLINELLSTNDPDRVEIANKIKNNVLPIIYRLEEELAQYFSLLTDFVNQVNKKQESGRKVLRITEKIKANKGFNQILESNENIAVELAEWINEMDTIKQSLSIVGADEELITDFGGQLKEIKEFKYLFSEWNALDDSNFVYWIEVGSGKRITAYLYAVPIEIGPYIREYLFDKLESVVLTSATLSVNDSFNYIVRELGFEENSDEIRRITVPSPFDYKKQAHVFIPKDVPNIFEVKEDVYIDNLAKKIAEVALTFNGKTLVLFTSHKMLQQTYEILKPTLEPFQIKVLGHGIDSNSRSKLIGRFASNSQTILLGTNSFWEGVDVPGEALSALIIARLPFTPPDNPLFEAKSEKIKQKGKNPFMDLSVPEAVIRFKQGFGRLIRTRSDQGVVIVFDRRVVESRYGKAFLKSLPDTNIKYQPFSSIINNIENWLRIGQS